MADTRVIGAGGATSDYLLSRVVWLAAAARELSVRHATCYLLITSNASSPGTLLGLHVASWLKPSPHQQQCRSNIRLCCQKRQQCRTSFALKFRPFDKLERCFDIVGQNGNIIETTGNKVACSFDNVASTLLLVWTGL